VDMVWTVNMDLQTTIFSVRNLYFPSLFLRKNGKSTPYPRS